MNKAEQFILNNLSTAVLSLDHELKLCYLNQAAESLLEISQNQGRGHGIARLLVEPEELERVLYDSLQTNHPYTKRKASLRLLTGDEIIVDYTVSPVNDDEQPRLLVELYPLSRYLRIDRDELLRAYQETTRQMIRGLAHEIKNPLGGIRGSAQLLDRELDRAALREYTSIIIEETDRLTSLVDRLLGPNTLPDPRPCNVHEILEKVSRLIDAEARGQITIHRDYDPSIPEINVDPELLLQALLNIARNALQVMRDTPNPVITLVTRTERQFTIGTSRHKLVAKIDIIDNGPGIPEALKEQLFFPMISGRPDGTGLGLPFAQSIIHQHRGLIEFNTKPGGTVFTVMIPIETKPENS